MLLQRLATSKSGGHPAVPVLPVELELLMENTAVASSRSFLRPPTGRITSRGTSRRGSTRDSLTALTPRSDRPGTATRRGSRSGRRRSVVRITTDPAIQTPPLSNAAPIFPEASPPESPLPIPSEYSSSGSDSSLPEGPPSPSPALYFPTEHHRVSIGSDVLTSDTSYGHLHAAIGTTLQSLRNNPRPALAVCCQQYDPLDDNISDDVGQQLTSNISEEGSSYVDSANSSLQAPTIFRHKTDEGRPELFGVEVVDRLQDLMSLRDFTPSGYPVHHVRHTTLPPKRHVVHNNRKRRPVALTPEEVEARQRRKLLAPFATPAASDVIRPKRNTSGTNPAREMVIAKMKLLRSEPSLHTVFERAIHTRSHQRFRQHVSQCGHNFWEENTKILTPRHRRRLVEQRTNVVHSRRESAVSRRSQIAEGLTTVLEHVEQARVALQEAEGFHQVERRRVVLWAVLAAFGARLRHQRYWTYIYTTQHRAALVLQRRFLPRVKWRRRERTVQAWCVLQRLWLRFVIYLRARRKCRALRVIRTYIRLFRPGMLVSVKVRSYKHHIHVAQRAIRSFLQRRELHYSLLALQWDAIEQNTVAAIRDQEVVTLRKQMENVPRRGVTHWSGITERQREQLRRRVLHWASQKVCIDGTLIPKQTVAEILEELTVIAKDTRLLPAHPDAPVVNQNQRRRGPPAEVTSPLKSIAQGRRPQSAPVVDREVPLHPVLALTLIDGSKWGDKDLRRVGTEMGLLAKGRVLQTPPDIKHTVLMSAFEDARAACRRARAEYNALRKRLKFERTLQNSRTALEQKMDLPGVDIASLHTEGVVRIVEDTDEHLTEREIGPAPRLPWLFPAEHMAELVLNGLNAAQQQQQLQYQSLVQHTHRRVSQWLPDEGSLEP